VNLIISHKLAPLRRLKLEVYARAYLEVIADELHWGNGANIRLLLRKFGFIARTGTEYTIIVNETIFDWVSEYRLRFITARIVTQFYLYDCFNDLLCITNYSNKQETILTMSRGYCYDFIKSFQIDCKKAYCDHDERFCGLKCKNLFARDCRTYSDAEVLTASNKFLERMKDLDVLEILCANEQYGQIM